MLQYIEYICMLCPKHESFLPFNALHDICKKIHGLVTGVLLVCSHPVVIFHTVYISLCQCEAKGKKKKKKVPVKVALNLYGKLDDTMF